MPWSPTSRRSDRLASGLMEPVGTITWLPEAQEQEALAELTLLVHAMMCEREHVQACGGQAECGTCRIRVVSGAENLSPMTPDERELRLDHPGALADDERLACMTRPLGPIVIELPPGDPRDLREG